MPLMVVIPSNGHARRRVLVDRVSNAEKPFTRVATSLSYPGAFYTLKSRARRCKQSCYLWPVRNSDDESRTNSTSSAGTLKIHQLKPR